MNLSITKQLIVIMFLIVMSMSLSGCLLFELPLKIVKTVFDVMGGAFELIKDMPKPPPGVF